jgi:hypothetical protein
MARAPDIVPNIPEADLVRHLRDFWLQLPKTKKIELVRQDNDDELWTVTLTYL